MARTTMRKRIASVPKASVQASPDSRQVSNLGDIANAIRDEAVAHRTHGERGGDASSTGVFERRVCCSRLSLGLAASLARVLAANDERVVAVYGYQPTMSTTSEKRPQRSLASPFTCWLS